MASTITAAAIIFLVLAAWIAVERMAGDRPGDRPGDCPVPEDSGRCHQCGLEKTCGLSETALSGADIDVPEKTGN